MTKPEFLTSVELQSVSDKIGEIEKFTTGEIRVSIQRKNGFFEKNQSAEKLALKEFKKLGLDSTRDKTGLLFLILLKRKEFFILADSGLHKKLPDGFWENETQQISSYFRQGKFIDGILETLDKIGKILQEHFPSNENDNPNEQPNDVVIR